MMTLIFIVFVMLFVLASIFIDEEKHEEFQCNVQICTVIGAAAAILIVVHEIAHVSEAMYVDDLIAMYAEENQNIENQIDVVVKEYMEYESDTLIKFKGDSSITLVSLYPELKSDELIKTQIAIYQANNQKIKELRELKIKARIHRWLLYLGT